MAGTFPDVPGIRMAYDRDGSQVTLHDSPSHVYPASLGQMQELNNENATTVQANLVGMGIVFPELRDVTHIFVHHLDTSNDVRLQTSVDTTTGYGDGTWTTRVSNLTINGTLAAPGACRTGIVALSGITGIKGLKLLSNSSFSAPGVSAFHLYGNYSAGQNPDRLVLWDPSANSPILNGAYFDFGDVLRGSIGGAKSFRIKNNSATATANNITVNFQTLGDASPTIQGQFEVSIDGGTTWVTSVNIGNLAANATSVVMWMRRNINSGAALGPWQTRMVAAAATWS